MDDEALAELGEYGRSVTRDVVETPAPLGGDIISLWNAFGALEQKVRDLESQP